MFKACVTWCVLLLTCLQELQKDQNRTVDGWSLSHMQTLIYFWVHLFLGGGGPGGNSKMVYRLYVVTVTEDNGPDPIDCVISEEDQSKLAAIPSFGIEQSNEVFGGTPCLYGTFY